MARKRVSPIGFEQSIEKRLKTVDERLDVMETAYVTILDRRTLQQNDINNIKNRVATLENICFSDDEIEAIIEFGITDWLKDQLGVVPDLNDLPAEELPDLNDVPMEDANNSTEETVSYHSDSS